MLAGHSHGQRRRHDARRPPSRASPQAHPLCPRQPLLRPGPPAYQLLSDPIRHLLARRIPSLPEKLKATALSGMYGDPSRASLKARSRGYTTGLRIPGTVDHVLEIVRRWSAERGRASLRALRAGRKPTLLIWGDRDRAGRPALLLTTPADPHQVNPCSSLPAPGTSPSEDARHLQPGNARLAIEPANRPASHPRSTAAKTHTRP